MSNRIVTPRRHLVNFRVTEEEHRQIRQACLVRGSRGVSEYARWCVLESAHALELSSSAAEAAMLGPTVSWARDQIATFDRSLNRLVQTLDNLTAHLPVFEKD